MKTSLLIALLVAASPAAAHTDTTGTVGFDGDIVRTTDDAVQPVETTRAAAVNTVDAETARRTWRCRLLDYAMARKQVMPWQAVVVEYR